MRGEAGAGSERVVAVATSRTGRLLWGAAGTFFLCLGVAGVAVPLLPTTPFLLLAAACYLRGSPRMHRWMMTNKVFGRYLSDYYEGRGMSWRAKVGIVSLLWIVIGFSTVVATDSAIVRIILVAVAVVVSIHIIWIKTTDDGGDRHDSSGT